MIEIDGNYDNQLANPYTANAGASNALRIGVIAWSLGRRIRHVQVRRDKNFGNASDDVISWQ